MFLKLNETVAPCRVACMTKEFITVVHELCKDTPTLMVFKRNGTDTTLLPARKSFKWKLVTLPFGATNILSD